MKRFPLQIFATVSLPLFVVGCPDDAPSDEEVGATDTSTDEATTGDTTDDEADVTTSTDDATTDTTSTTDESTTDDATTTDTTDSTTDGTTTDTTETATDTGGVCGDMVIDANEDCEGADLGGADCAALGYSGGELLCGADCIYDESGCYMEVCGDGVIQGNEECDTDDLGGADCPALGYASGALYCAADCTYDVASCSNCGNDVIDAPEVCDGADLGGSDCVALGYLGGTLSCNGTCDALVEDLCATDWWGEDFEGGAVLPAEWVLSGNANWFGGVNMPHAGAFNGESGNIADSQQSHMDVALNFVQAGTVRFWYRVSSEQNWDYLRFYVDGVQQTQWSGNIPAWTQTAVYNVAAGNHTLRWTYYKDSTVSAGSDTVWVDDIVTVGALLP